MEITYKMAYTEVLEILRKLPSEELAKIPQSELKFYEKNCDKNYIFSIDASIPIEQQKISRKANAILVTIYRDFFASEQQKQKLESILKSNLIKLEEERKKIYNYDNLFKNKEKDTKDTKEELQILKKDNIFIKIIKKIKKFFSYE